MDGTAGGTLDDTEDFTATIIEPAAGSFGTRGLFTRPDPRIDPRIERRRTPTPNNENQGILYAEDFDLPPPMPAEPPSPAPSAPSFSTADIDAARAAGREEGFAAAAADQDALRADRHVTATQSLADAMSAARQELADIAEQSAHALSGAILAILSASLPKLSEIHAQAEVTAIMQALLPGVRAEPVLRVRIHPDVESSIRTAWAQLTEDEPAGDLQLTADASMAPGDIRLSWADGRASRNTAAIWNEIRGALAPLGMPKLQELAHGQ